MLKLFSLLALLFCLSPAQGVLNESTKPAQVNVYLEQNPPYSTFNSAQDVQGIFVDYWQQWADLTGITVNYHLYLDQDLSSLSDNNQPAFYSGLQANPELLADFKKQYLFTINSRFYYLSMRNDLITTALIDKKSAITVGGLLPEAQQLPLFSTVTNISYKEYPGLVELLIAVYSEQVDTLVLFEGAGENLTVLNWLLSLFFDEKPLTDIDNELFVYAPEVQASVLEWVDWGNQFDGVSNQVATTIAKATNSIWGISAEIQIKILIVVGGIFLLFVISRSKRKKDRHFESLFNDSPYPLVILSLDGSVIYYLNAETKSLLSTKKVNKQYIFEEEENNLLLSQAINKVSHQTIIELQQIRLLVDNSFHDIEISAKRVHYKGKTAWLCYLKDVNALLRAEQKLIEERELLRKVLDSIPEQISFKSAKGSIIGCNESWAKANKTTVIKATGRRISHFLPADIVNKQKQQEATAWSGKKFHNQEWVQQKNDALRLIKTAKLPLYNNKGIVFAILSIESDESDLYNLNKKLVDENLQRKKTEIALSKQSALLSTVFAASIDPIGLLDQEGRVIGANNAFAVLMGSNPDDIIGRLQSEFLSEEHSDWAASQNKQVLESGKPLIFEELTFFKGKKICYEVCKTPFNDTESNYQGIVIMARDITLHKQIEEKLSSDASNFEVKMLHDPLTEIANRRAFDLQFNKLWQEACAEQELLSIVMCDIDFFKLYNDNYGHQQGDQALQSVAQALQRSCEKSGCFVARYGGEEFVVLIKGGNATKALKISEALREAVAQAKVEHLYSSVKTIVTLSMGLSSILPSELNTMSMLLAEADSALYQAKKDGRDQICVH